MSNRWVAWSPKIPNRERQNPGRAAPRASFDCWVAISRPWAWHCGARRGISDDQGKVNDYTKVGECEEIPIC